MSCLDENVLAEYVDNVLGEAQRRAADQHLDICPACRAAVSDLARMQHATDDRTQVDTVAVRVTAQLRRRTAHIVAGTMIGEYEVTDTLGSGGMGVVFAAVHPRIGKKVAIKVLQRDLAFDAIAIARFENEARTVNAIGHPNIIDIFAFGELPNGDPYFVMEHIAGQTLQERIVTGGPVSLARAMPILRQIFDALTAAHERGVIHRDLKPGNIMVAGSDDAPRVTVVDFGLAKLQRSDLVADELTQPGLVVGTPHFMSPEQFLGRELDQRSDVYALGVLIYQMLCGTYPFHGATPSAVGEQHLYDTPPALSKLAGLPPQIDRVIDKALAKDVAERYRSVRELREDLERCLTETTAPAPVLVATPPAARAPRLVPRWAIAAAVGAAIVTALIVWAVGARPEPAAAVVAPRPASPAPLRPAVTPPAPEPQAAPQLPPATAPVAPTETELAASKPPPRAPAKRTARRTTKPAETTPRAGSAAAPEDDRMLLEGGSVMKP